MPNAMKRSWNWLAAFSVSFVAAGSFLLQEVSAQSTSLPKETSATAKDGSYHRGQPILHRRVAVPEAFLTTSDGFTYGGDVRMGDLTSNGQADPLVYRAAHSVDGRAVQPCFIGALQSLGSIRLYLYSIAPQ